MAQKWRFSTKFLKLSLIAQRRTWITDYQYSEDIESGRSIDTTKSGNIVCSMIKVCLMVKLESVVNLRTMDFEM